MSCWQRRTTVYSGVKRQSQFFPEAKRQNMGIVIGAPLQQGALSRRHVEVETGAWWLSRPRQEQFKALYRVFG